MEIRHCSFCGSRIEPGTGKMFVRRDGSVLYFESSKCERNFLKLRREPRRVLWTDKGREQKDQRIKFARELELKQQEVKSEKEPEVEEENKEELIENKG